MTKLVDAGTNILNLMIKFMLISMMNSLLSLNTKRILYLRMQTGDKILLIEEFMRYQELKHRNKDYKFYKGKIGNCEKK